MPLTQLSLQGMGGSRTYWIRALHVSLAVGFVPTMSLTEEQERTFSDVIFLSSDFATLIPLEDTATRRPCWVYYPRMPRVYPIVWVNTSAAYLLLIHVWRGLAELLILMEGQCEGQMTGISSRRFLPRLFLYPKMRKRY